MINKVCLNLFLSIQRNIWNINIMFTFWTFTKIYHINGAVQQSTEYRHYRNFLMTINKVSLKLFYVNIEKYLE